MPNSKHGIVLPHRRGEFLEIRAPEPDFLKKYKIYAFPNRLGRLGL
ncbi:hypothetical protein BH23VER1_BH23VER1_36870 [soil metagenome]